MTITRDRLLEALSFEPLSGEFRWKLPPWNHPRLFGEVAGCEATGYTLIKIDGRKYKAHRLAWLYVYGAWPSSRLDHRDGNTFNNAIENLRLATPAQNNANANRWAGKALPKGVRHTRNRFTARISVDGKLKHIGTYSTPEEAAAAYARAATHFYGDFARAA